MLAICFVPLSLRRSSPGISQVGLRPGSLILSVLACPAISVKRVSVWSCCAGVRVHWGGVTPVSCLHWGSPVGGVMLSEGVVEEGEVWGIGLLIGELVGEASGRLMVEGLVEVLTGREGVLRLKERLLLVKGILLC